MSGKKIGESERLLTHSIDVGDTLQFTRGPLYPKIPKVFAAQ